MELVVEEEPVFVGESLGMAKKSVDCEAAASPAIVTESPGERS